MENVGTSGSYCALTSWISGLLLASVAFLLHLEVTFCQGETTSAIIGQVSDETGAALAGSMVTITNTETGLKRSAATDDAGRFNFPQLKPGTYAVKAEAEGFDPQQNDDCDLRA